MRIKAWLIADGKMTHNETYPPCWGLASVVSELRRLWNEEAEGDQTFILTDERGKTLATMIRCDDPEVALTVYSDGMTEKHRCHYLTDGDGFYAGTEVTRIK